MSILKISSLGGLFSKLRSGIDLVNDLVDFYKVVMTGLSVAVSGFGATGILSQGSSRGSLIKTAEMGLAPRFTLAVLIACAQGYLLAWAIGKLSAKGTEFAQIIAIIAAIVSAGLLVTSADWLAHSRGILPELYLFTAIGMAATSWIAVFRFRNEQASTAKAVIQARGVAMMTFSLACVLVLILTELGTR